MCKEIVFPQWSVVYVLRPVSRSVNLISVKIVIIFKYGRQFSTTWKICSYSIWLAVGRRERNEKKLTKSDSWDGRKIERELGTLHGESIDCETFANIMRITGCNCNVHAHITLIICNLSFIRVNVYFEIQLDTSKPIIQSPIRSRTSRVLALRCIFAYSLFLCNFFCFRVFFHTVS